MFIISSPIGNLGFTIQHNQVIEVHLDVAGAVQTAKTSLEKKITEEIDRYFHDAKTGLDIPYKLTSTEYQKRIYDLLLKIPVGSTLTYGRIALQLRSHPRAVGQALRANPLPLLIPCHRVIGCKGLTGFAGQTKGRALHIKRSLLVHEGVST